MLSRAQTQSLNPTQRFATKLAQLTERGWGELAAGARYRPISIVNLIRKLREVTFLTCIFIWNNIISTCPLEISAIPEFEQKWRENTPLNPRKKNHRTIRMHCSASHGSKSPPGYATALGQRQAVHHRP
jgi:hypothetical protein